MANIVALPCLVVRFPACVAGPASLCRKGLRYAGPMGCGNGGLTPIDNVIRPGAHKVFCVKFQREMEGLDEVPFEGHPLGQKIYESVSKEAWKMWVEHMKMIMNEYRLNLGTKEAQEFLIEQMGLGLRSGGRAAPAPKK